MSIDLAVDDVSLPYDWPSVAECAEALRQWEAREHAEWSLALAPCWVDVDEDGRARLRMVETVPDSYGLTALERELLDGLARIIAADILHRREVARC